MALKNSLSPIASALPTSAKALAPIAAAATQAPVAFNPPPLRSYNPVTPAATAKALLSPSNAAAAEPYRPVNGVNYAPRAPLTAQPTYKEPPRPMGAPPAPPQQYSGGPAFTPPTDSGAKTPSGLPFVPPMTDTSTGEVVYEEAYPDAPYQDSSSQAMYNDPNLPDDSGNWNDPAPAALVRSAVMKAEAKSNPGIPQVKPSLWTRILMFLGFVKAPAALPAASVNGEPVTVEQAAKSIVRRVENGDQHAMALMVMIRENAQKGNPTAQKTLRLMKEYAGRSATVAGEPARPNAGWGHAVRIANGPILFDHRIADVASSFGEERDHKAFVSGVLLPSHPAVSSAHHHGKVLGMARKIQAVRMANSRISDYSATVGWELGES